MIKRVSQAMVMALFGALILAGCAGRGAGSGDKELATISDQTNTQKRANIRLQLAISYYEKHQNETALDEIKQAIQIEPNFADAYGVRALIYMDMGETRLADDNFQHALRLSPEDPDLINNYGWFLCQNKRPAESIDYFERALKSRTYQSPAKALNNAGMCSLKLGKTEVAERYFTQAFRFDPTLNSASLNLSKLAYVRKDWERAKFYIDRVIKSDVYDVESVWLAIRIEHHLGERLQEATLGIQLKRRFPGSDELVKYENGAFDE